jgi:hypothetical protein
MRTAVCDSAAIEFASAFYRALAYGHSVEESFRLARNLLALNKQAAKTPTLFKRRGANASEFFLATAPAALSKAEGTRSPAVKESSSRLWIHGWVKRIYDDLPAVELNWTAYFDRRKKKVPSQQTWNKHLFPNLLEAKKRIDKQRNGSFIDLRGKLSLTAMLAVGTTFPEAGGYRFRTEQPTQGTTTLWRSDVKPSEREFKVTTEKRRRGEGKDVLIALSNSGDALSDIVALFEKHPDTF